MDETKALPLISIIVPVYNVKDYVEKCLDSICGQSYTNLEIVVVDDGSTDGSGKICDAYASKDRRIKVIHRKNGGLSAARNYEERSFITHASLRHNLVENFPRP